MTLIPWFSEEFLVLRDLGKTPLPLPLWVMPSLHVVLTGMACLAAWRQWHAPSRLRRYTLQGYALITLISLPARTMEQAELARILFILLSVALLFMLANIRRSGGRA